MYKDKDKQREANRKAQAKFKAKGITKQDMEGITDRVLPKDVPPHGLTAGFENTELVLQEMPVRKYVLVESNPNNPKRGKDIKCFADLPPDIQQTIDKMSESEQEHKRRTAIAISYQHSHANRYYPEDAALSFVVTGKPGDADYNGVCTDEWRAERGR